MKSLLNADIEQEKNERLILYWTTFNLFIPLVAPAALGSVVPPVAFVWFALGTIGSIFLGTPRLIIPVLAILYLACSATVWVGMVIVRRKYPRYDYRRRS